MSNLYKYRYILVIFFVLQFILFATTVGHLAGIMQDTLSSITHIYHQNKAVPELHKGTVFSFQFTAKENNLGIIGIPISAYTVRNYGTLTFRIKEDGESGWTHTNSYNSIHITNTPYYPFGFPRQINSLGKHYTVQLATTGKGGEKVEINLNKKVYVKYVFMRKEVQLNLIGFIIKKISSYIPYIDTSTVVIALILSVIMVYLILLRKKLLDHFLPYVNPKNHIQVLKAHISRLNEKSYKKQISFILLFLILFVDSALISRYTDKLSIPFLSYVLIIVLHVSLLFFLVKTQFNFSINKSIIPNYFFLLFLFLLLILRLQFMQDMPRWDGGNNFLALISSLKTFNFTFSQFFSGFQWWGHSSYGIAIFIAILNFINPSNLLLLQISFLLLHILLYGALFSLFKQFFKLSNILSTLFSALVVFTPIIFTSSIIFSIDYPVLVFFIAFLALFSQKKYCLAIFFGGLTVFSKEIGVLIYGTFIISYSLYEILREILNKERKKEFNSFLTNLYKYVFLCSPLFMFGFYVLLNNGNVWGGGVGSIWSSFSINDEVAYQRFGQMAVLNWNWLLWLLLIFLFITSKKMAREIFENGFITALFATGIMYTAFNLTYITVTHPRYVIMAPFFLIIFIAVYVRERKEEILLRTILCFLIFLNVIQIFRTIDPVSKLYFGSMRFGNHTLLKISDDFSSRCDSMVYNTEFTYINRLFTRMNKTLIIKPQDTLIFSTLKEKQDRDAWLTYYEQAYVNNPSLELTYNSNHSFKPNIYYANTLPTTLNFNKKGNLYYVYLPWLSQNNRDIQLTLIKRLFTVSSAIKIELNGYYLNVYKLTKR